jgi:hypothetical protein
VSAEDEKDREPKVPKGASNRGMKAGLYVYDIESLLDS